MSRHFHTPGRDLPMITKKNVNPSSLIFRENEPGYLTIAQLQKIQNKNLKKRMTIRKLQ